MDSTTHPSSRTLIAYTLPMGVFLGMLAVNSGLKQLGQSFLLASAEYWLYPVQTIICGALLIYFRREYEIHRIRKVGLTLGVAVIVWLLWIAPQAFLGFTPRLIGFNPEVFEQHSALYSATVALRFLRLVVVVPFVEEIFWRGFLLRYFINEQFTLVKFGTFTWLSFLGVSLGFGFAHSLPDLAAAILTGMLFNAVAYWTRSLGSCVLVHAVTNLLLGLWIMHTRQWGFW